MGTLNTEPPHTQSYNQEFSYNASAAASPSPVHTYPPPGGSGTPQPPAYGQPLASTVQNGEPVHYFATNNSYAGPAYANPSGPSGYTQPAQTSDYMQPAQGSGYMQPAQSSGYMYPAQSSGYVQAVQTSSYAQPVQPAGYDVKGNPVPFPAQGSQQPQFGAPPPGPGAPGTTVFVQTYVNPNVVNDGGLSSMAFVCFVIGWCFPLAWYIGIFDIRNKNPNVRVWAYVDTVLAVLTTIGVIILIIEIIALENAARSSVYYTYDNGY